MKSLLEFLEEISEIIDDSIKKLVCKIELRKIKGHAGDDWNELADQLATGCITEEEAYASFD